MKIAKTTDRFDINYSTYTITVSPLRYDQKIEILDQVKIQGGVEVSDIRSQAFLAIKYGVKDLKGFQNYDDSSYQVALDNAGNLTDDCASEVLEALTHVKINDNSVLAPIFWFLTGNKKLPEGVSIKLNGKEIDLGNA